MILFDTEYIENINNAMLFVLDSENRVCGKEVVVEDGRIAGVYENRNLIVESPKVGSETWIDGERVGVMSEAKEGKPIPCLEIDGNTFSAFALAVEFKGHDIRFVSPDGGMVRC